LFQYVPEGHALRPLLQADVRAQLQAAAFDQAAVGTAPLVIVLTGVIARTEVKYGERAARYVDLEAGHAAQNVLLEAVALELAAVPVGSFDDRQVLAALHAPAYETPLYLLPVGWPA
jgi:SagB-type dehydrogenase family enzyme